MKNFELVSSYKPSGDQPEAIKQLVEGVNRKVSRFRQISNVGQFIILLCILYLCQKDIEPDDVKVNIFHCASGLSVFVAVVKIGSL